MQRLLMALAPDPAIAAKQIREFGTGQPGEALPERGHSDRRPQFVKEGDDGVALAWGRAACGPTERLQALTLATPVGLPLPQGARRQVQARGNFVTSQALGAAPLRELDNAATHDVLALTPQTLTDKAASLEDR